MPITNSPSPISPVSALRKIIAKDFAIVKDVTYPTLSYMVALGRTRDASQTTINWNADVGGEGTNFRDIVSDAGSNSQGNTEPASLSIGQSAITHVFDLSKVEVEMAANVGVEAIKDLFKSHLDRGRTKILRDLNKAILDGDGTLSNSCRVIGFDKIVDPTYNYAGINRTTYTRWRSPQLINGGTPRNLTVSLMLSMETELITRERTYNAIVTTPLLAQKYKELFNASRSFQVNNGANAADLGISDISYNGRPILVDPQCPTGKMFFLDTNDLYVHSFVTKDDVVIDGLRFMFSELPVSNGYQMKYEMGIIPQFQAFNSQAVGVLGDLQ